MDRGARVAGYGSQHREEPDISERLTLLLLTFTLSIYQKG